MTGTIDQGADDPVSIAEWYVGEKMRHQGNVPTYQDNYVRRLVKAVRSEPAAAVDGESGALTKLRAFAGLVSGPRFADPAIRLGRSRTETLAAMGADAATIRASQGVRSAPMWAGRPLFKTVYDLGAYPMLIGEVGPATVIELGSGSGASAVWMADVAGAHGLRPRIVSVDCVDVEVSDPRIDFIRGDIADLDSILADSGSWEHPWLVIEDAHVHVAEVLAYFHRRLVPGDYLIVEDSMHKRDDLRAFIHAAPHSYTLDTFYLDLFGENTTCAVDSIFRRE